MYDLLLSANNTDPYDYFSHGDPVAGVPGDRSNPLTVSGLVLDSTGGTKDSNERLVYLVATGRRWSDISLSVVPWSAKTLAFSSADQSINLSSGAFPDILPGQEVTISGATNAGNNGAKVVASRTETKITFEGSGIVDEAEGDEITISHAGVDFLLSSTSGGAFGATLTPADMNALTLDQTTEVYAKARAQNDGSVISGRYGFFGIDIQGQANAD